MNAYEVYVLYLALKHHFTEEKYDYFKYHGKVKANAISFHKRNDRYFFEKVAKHKDPAGFILANLVSVPGTYIRDIAYSEQAEEVYTQWLKRKESLTYEFTQDLSRLDPNFNNNFICGSGRHPNLLRLYLANKISLETLCILVKLTGCMKYWHKKLKGDVVYDDIELLVRKYLPFLQFDKEKFTKIIRNNYKE